MRPGGPARICLRVCMAALREVDAKVVSTEYVPRLRKILGIPSFRRDDSRFGPVLALLLRTFSAFSEDSSRRDSQKALLPLLKDMLRWASVFEPLQKKAKVPSTLAERSHLLLQERQLKLDTALDDVLKLPSPLDFQRSFSANGPLWVLLKEFSEPLLKAHEAEEQSFCAPAFKKRRKTFLACQERNEKTEAAHSQAERRSLSDVDAQLQKQYLLPPAP